MKHLTIALVLATAAVGCDPWAGEETHSFELEGRHAEIACGACHTQDRVEALPTDCESCHLSDAPEDHYDRPCEVCHTPAGWDEEILHGFFRLPHFGHDQCVECHTTGDNRVFECIECHAHTQEEMAQEHQGQANYEWTSEACFGCHVRRN